MWRAANLYQAYGKRQFSGFVSTIDTGRLQYMYRQERTCASENAFPSEGKVSAQADG